MPFELSQLLQPLQRSLGAELDSSDERLLGPDADADKGDFAHAARAVEALLEAGIYDWRPLPYYLYQAFVDGGYRGLLTVLKVVENLLGPSRDAVFPEKRRDDYLNRRLHWLFDKVEAALAYHAKAGTAEGARWQLSLSVEVLDALLVVSGHLAVALAAHTHQQAGTALGRLTARIREQKLVDKSVTPASGSTGEAAPEAAAPSAPVVAAITSGISGDQPERVELAVSPRFLQLCRSLEAFEQLVEKREFRKAAVVSADIAESLDQFDPRLYFPGLFAAFAALYSKHVDALSANADDSSPAWRALKQHYQVDLQGFIRG